MKKFKSLLAMVASLALALSLSACNLQGSTAELELDSDGSGKISVNMELDYEAGQQLVKSKILKNTDLKGWEKGETKSFNLLNGKEFKNLDELKEILQEQLNDEDHAWLSVQQDDDGLVHVSVETAKLKAVDSMKKMLERWKVIPTQDVIDEIWRNADIQLYLKGKDAQLELSEGSGNGVEIRNNEAVLHLTEMDDQLVVVSTTEQKPLPSRWADLDGNEWWFDGLMLMDEWTYGQVPAVDGQDAEWPNFCADNLVTVAEAKEWAKAVGVNVKNADGDQSEHPTREWTAWLVVQWFNAVADQKLVEGVKDQIVGNVEEKFCPDVESINGTFLDAVHQAYKYGIIVGQDDQGHFNPKGLVTRGQLAAMWGRAIQLSGALDAEGQ